MMVVTSLGLSRISGGLAYLIARTQEEQQNKENQ